LAERLHFFWWGLEALRCLFSKAILKETQLDGTGCGLDGFHPLHPKVFIQKRVADANEVRERALAVCAWTTENGGSPEGGNANFGTCELLAAKHANSSFVEVEPRTIVIVSSKQLESSRAGAGG
jgi:hypothetical protein